jgi:hypothetical protein
VPRRVSDLVAAPARSAPLDGASALGEAASDRLMVRIGLWLDRGRVRRARWRASTCASLIAYSEAACEALEDGTPPQALDAAALRALVLGVHPIHHDRAALVARAVLAAHQRTGGVPA